MAPAVKVAGAQTTSPWFYPAAHGFPMSAEHRCLVPMRGGSTPPLMALAPATTTPAWCPTVAARCSTTDAAQAERSPIAGRPVTLDVALRLGLVGRAGSLTVVLVVVGAAST